MRIALIRLESLLIENKIPIPDDLRSDLADIKRDAEGDESEVSK